MRRRSRGMVVVVIVVLRVRGRVQREGKAPMEVKQVRNITLRVLLLTFDVGRKV